MGTHIHREAKVVVSSQDRSLRLSSNMHSTKEGKKTNANPQGAETLQ